MPTVTWTLTDADEGVDLTNWSVGPEDVGGDFHGWSVSKRRLVGGRRDGVSVVEVDNGRMRFTVVPTRGMGILRCVAGETTLGWQSPVDGPVHPQFVPVTDPGGLGWLEGFDELLVRCGLESNGAPVFDSRNVLQYPLHGRIANLPAHRVTLSVDRRKGTISVTGEVDETRFLFRHLRMTSTLTTTIGSTQLSIHDSITNLSSRPAGFQMLYHINVGAPLLDCGSRLLAPVKAVVPRDERAAEGVGRWDSYSSPEPGFAEQVYFLLDLTSDADGRTRVLLKNAAGDAGLGLSFNRKQLPWFTQWKNTGAIEDGYVTGLEPATNLPNPRDFEERQDRVVPLGPGASYGIDFDLNWLLNAEDVEAAAAEVRKLTPAAAPEIFTAPQRGWCAGV
jgi:galactose mutarotase-like enzyme